MAFSLLKVNLYNISYLNNLQSEERVVLFEDVAKDLKGTLAHCHEIVTRINSA